MAKILMDVANYVKDRSNLRLRLSNPLSDGEAFTPITRKAPIYVIVSSFKSGIVHIV